MHLMAIAVDEEWQGAGIGVPPFLRGEGARGLGQPDGLPQGLESGDRHWTAESSCRK